MYLSSNTGVADLLETHVDEIILEPVSVVMAGLSEEDQCNTVTEGLTLTGESNSDEVTQLL